MKEIALIMFVATYGLLLTFPKWRHYIALTTALLFVAIGIMPLQHVFTTINWNVIMMIGGTMGIVSLFVDSKMPALMADIIIDKMPDVKWAIIALSLFAGIISAFVDNVATVLMVAPVALNIAKKLKISPVPSIIAIAVASNLQGAATLVGDTTSILLGGYANMNFTDFFVFHGRIGIFWVVQVGALASTLVLFYLFRKENQLVHLDEKTVVTDYFPTFLLSGTILLLIIASFIPSNWNLPASLMDNINGLICVALLVIGLLREYLVRHKPDSVAKAIMEIDYQTILLLASLFLVIGGLTEVGIVSDISKLFLRFSGDNLFVIYSLIVWASVFFSAFIDNIPYVATMLPVVSGIAVILKIDPTILYLGLLAGATLGGNLTPIGASANITALGILRKDGYDVSSWEFMKIGIPFTLAAVISAYIMIWVIWA